MLFIFLKGTNVLNVFFGNIKEKKNVDNLDDGYAIGSDKIVGDGKATYSSADT